MKELFGVLLLAISSVYGEAPYPPSGWKPSGPAFELPRSTSQTPAEYLPPSVDPRRLPSDVTPDVSVQGLPTSEQVPQFQLSPVSGQEYIGPAVQTDVARLNEQARQAQIQNQQSQFRNIERQRHQFTAQFSSGQTTAYNPQSSVYNTPQASVFESSQTTYSTVVPSRKLTSTTPRSIEPTTAQTKNIPTESLNLGEVNTNENQNPVEITKLNIQEYPPEVFLNPLTQLRFASLPNNAQFGQLVYQKQNFDTNQQQYSFDGPSHLKALQAVLEQQNQQQQQTQNLQQNQQQQQTQNLQQNQQQQQTQNLQQNQQLQQTQYLQQNQQQTQNQQQNQIPLQNQQFINGYVAPQESPNFIMASAPRQTEQQLPQQALQPQLIQQQLYQTQYQLPPALYQPNTQVNFEQLTEEDLIPRVALNKEVGTDKDEDINREQYIPQPIRYLGQLQPQLQYQFAQPQFTDPQLNQPQILQPQLNQQQFNTQQQTLQTQEVDQINLQRQLVLQQAYQQRIQPQFVYQSKEVNEQPGTYQVRGLESNNQQFDQNQRQFQTPNQQQSINQPDLVVYDQRRSNSNAEQTRGVLQSGLDPDHGGNDIEPQGKNSNEDNSAVETSMNLPFGERTRPRVYSSYGAPEQRPNDQPSISDTSLEDGEHAMGNTDKSREEAGGPPAVAEATAVARGGKRRNSRIKAIRTRPVFTVDRSGYLMLENPVLQQ